MKKPEKPYVGQQVIFRDSWECDPCAAVVTYVGGSTVVHACVFMSDGHTEPRCNANYWDGKGPRPTSRVVSEE